MPYLSNPLLNTIPPSPNWQGTPVDDRGRFRNIDHPYITTLPEVLKWQLQKNPFKQQKRTRYQPNISTDLSWLSNEQDCMVWLGHCTFYIRLHKTVFLTDPVFGNILFNKRVSPFPLDPQLLKGIHYLLLSHDHRDHCDKQSLGTLFANNPQIQVLTGLHMDALLRKWGKNVNVQTAGWYQQYQTTESGPAVYFVPTRHWAKRGAFDTNKRLWGGFVIKHAQTSIYFGGDSGYNGHYKLASQTFGPFNYALLGIGAYEPEWFMHVNHQSPTDALQAFKDLQASRLIPMHYGTFDLSDEPLYYPLQQLQQAAQTNGLAAAMLIPALGQPVYL